MGAQPRAKLHGAHPRGRVQILAGLPDLRHLDASCADFQMHAPDALPLSHLHLGRGATAGEACPPAARAAALTFLSVAGRVLTQPLVSLVAAMASLRYLDISSCQVEDEDAPLLAPLGGLRTLRGVRMRHMLGRFNYQASGAAHESACLRRPQQRAIFSATPPARTARALLLFALSPCVSFSLTPLDGFGCGHRRPQWTLLKGPVQLVEAVQSQCAGGVMQPHVEQQLQSTK